MTKFVDPFDFRNELKQMTDSKLGESRGNALVEKKEDLESLHKSLVSYSAAQKSVDSKTPATSAVIDKLESCTESEQKNKKIKPSPPMKLAVNSLEEMQPS